MTTSLMERGRPHADDLSTGFLIPEQATADCRGCLGRSMPTVGATYDNHAPVGPLCADCVRVAGDGRRPVVVQPCDGCFDHGPARLLGRVAYCAFCVVTLVGLHAEAAT
ncbi:hypothetical protein JIG36_32105 [Actinoplanes sp. LDG1-06]|uniref:Uncharacterized protein n=1 Tax=Paractinoplanes ovalisporus TaxID=2810368 RepID=A0ABS2ALD0_9ACTN|nr:hypothetical protein [Actinoplanes ovalisporus]MBM2620168.1 hypothetical protein [Actinoplanes ovalisporus]